MLFPYPNNPNNLKLETNKQKTSGVVSAARSFSAFYLYLIVSLISRVLLFVIGSVLDRDSS